MLGVTTGVGAAAKTGVHSSTVAVSAVQENSKWCQNPQFHIEVIDPFAKEDIHLKIVLRRTDKPAAEAAGKFRGVIEGGYCSILVYWWCLVLCGVV